MSKTRGRSLLACDMAAFREHVGDRWHLWSNHGGTLRPFNDHHPEVLDVRSQPRVRRRSALDPWIIDLVITPDRDGLWTSKRDPDHVAPLDDVTWVDDGGVRWLKPEVTLLYKAVLHGPRTTATSRSRGPAGCRSTGVAPRLDRAPLPAASVAAADGLSQADRAHASACALRSSVDRPSSRCTTSSDSAHVESRAVRKVRTRAHSTSSPRVLAR